MSGDLRPESDDGSADAVSRLLGTNTTLGIIAGLTLAAANEQHHDEEEDPIPPMTEPLGRTRRRSVFGLLGAGPNGFATSSPAKKPPGPQATVFSVQAPRETIQRLQNHNKLLKQELSIEARAARELLGQEKRSRVEQLRSTLAAFARKLVKAQRQVEKTEQIIHRKTQELAALRLALQPIPAHEAAAAFAAEAEAGTPGKPLAAAAAAAAVSGRLRVAENRLELALVRKNEVDSANKHLLARVDAARRDRIIFDGIYKKLERETSGCKARHEQAKADLTRATQAREALAREVARLQDAAEREQFEYEHQFQELKRSIEHWRRETGVRMAASELQNSPLGLSELDANSEQDKANAGALSRVTALSSWKIGVDRALTSVPDSLMTKYDQAFAAIRERTGLQDASALAQDLLARDAANFQRFKRVEELSREEVALQTQVAVLTTQIETFKAREGIASRASQKQHCRRVEAALRETQQACDDLDAEIEERDAVLGRIKASVHSVHNTMAHASSGGSTSGNATALGQGITDSSAIEFLQAIETYTTALLQSKASGALAVAHSLGDEVMGNHRRAGNDKKSPEASGIATGEELGDDEEDERALTIFLLLELPRSPPAMSKATGPRFQRSGSIPGKGGAELHAGGEGAEIAAKSREVIDRLKKLYATKLRPLEKRYDFGDFHSPLLSDSDFEAKPQVLMIGQYSVGKTSFIEYLLGRPFPGQRVGPEPTTDRFVAVMHGEEERTVPGNAACVSPDLPYGGLSMFGTAFLNKFEVAQLPAPLLGQLTIVDTPGILSGEKQRIARGYDFTQVARWFAERSDLILLLFDAHKLDISDEFQRVIEVLQGQSDKVRCVLNKADQVDQQRLLRVYGALMWSLGKVLKTPEVMRVYLGSFWSQPRQKHGDDGSSSTPEALFDAEERDLLDELRALPQHAAVRKVNELVKRARLAKVHACILGHLRDKMPAVFGMEKKQRELLENMGENFREVQRKYHLPPGDFPPIDAFVRQCADRKFTKFPSLKSRELQDIDEMLTKDIPALMASLPKHTRVGIAGVENPENGSVSSNPFASIAPVGRLQWEEELLGRKGEYDAVFATLSLDVTGRAAGGSCMAPLQKQASTTVSQVTLRAIWDLADQSKAGSLDADEFAVAMHLCALAKEGEPIPAELPTSLVPPLSGKDQPQIGSPSQTSAIRRPSII
ncbi:hypothetical protein JG688_00006197 [Phytophthora aleatoria]|uniref:Calmodulin n=1 Tax=Phytophthora aleatoria TaxID=2496075 RepID=A0A8J5J8W7_9STRA|nr:hypothetical protein JG688_00006197 [Phytophthora aleatoria]